MEKGVTIMQSTIIKSGKCQNPALRMGFLALGLTTTALGIIGIFLPLMPTTIFMIIACWSFAKSSPKFHNWLITHKTLGPPIINWQKNGSIPRKAKCLAGTSISLSFLITLYFSDNFYVIGGVGLILATVMVYIITRPTADC